MGVCEAGRIVFGPGTRRQLAAAMRGLGSRPLLVTGRHLASDAAWAALDIDIDLDLRASTRFIVEGEPTVDLVRDGVRAYHESTCDIVIGIGGGSVLDAAKAIAALATNPGDAASRRHCRSRAGADPASDGDRVPRSIAIATSPSP